MTLDYQSPRAQQKVRRIFPLAFAMWGGLCSGILVTFIVGFLFEPSDPEGNALIPFIFGLYIVIASIPAIFFAIGVWLYGWFAHRQIRPKAALFSFLIGLGTGLLPLLLLLLVVVLGPGWELASDAFSVFELLLPAMLSILVTEPDISYHSMTHSS